MASFKEAFAAARKAQGAGGTFTWKGDSYSTNIVGEEGTKKKTSSDTDAVKKADDKAPKAGPSFNEAFAAARKAQGAGGTFTWKGDSYNTNLDSEKKLDSKVAGRGGFASGPASGMPKAPYVPKVAGRGGFASGPASGMPKAEQGILLRTGGVVNTMPATGYKNGGLVTKSGSKRPCKTF